MLSELTASARRLALVGLAKNTGKTQTLAALLGELEAQGRTVGVTSVGRDGEERDAIDARIEKPRVRLAAGSLVASTDALLRASAIAYDVLERTAVRTPLGRVQLARVRGAGVVEIAGPSAAADVRAVSDAMLAHGAQQVLIDGAVDRRAASSPAVSDGLVMATGAVLDRDIEAVVARTRDAVELMRMPVAGGDGRARVALPARFALTGDAARIAGVLDASPSARELLVPGALPESFLEQLALVARARGRELTLVVSDPTKVFLERRSLRWFARQGVHVRAQRSIALRALTVNPVAPQSHSFDSAQLRGLLSRAIPDVPIVDVLHADYAPATVSSF
jgi:hypothetical protein